ncbi:MAG: GNAT family N-acetyltransferase [Erysipelotrichaceae bacterium]|nr:GNAT family N-acetyltransferase [Erysipelotrichaceae bacterium]
MKIRRAEEKDIPRIDELLNQVLEIHAEIRPDIFISGTRKYTDDELKKILNDEKTPVFAAVDENDVLKGYAFCVMEDTSGSNNLVPQKSLYIDDLCVDEKARGMHVGRILYDYVINYAKDEGCACVTLNVWEGNDSARAFYDKMGFTVRKTVMEKKL